MRPPPPLRQYGGKTLYSQIATDLREQIAERILRPGDPLPGEADLADHYGVGVNTIRSALALLRREGLVITEKAKGSSIAHAKEPLVINLPPGGQAEIRASTEAERLQLDLPDGALVVEVTDAAGEKQVLPALGMIIQGSGEGG